MKEALQEAFACEKNSRSSDSISAGQSGSPCCTLLSQRLPLPPGDTAEDIAREYQEFLPKMRAGFMEG